MAEPRDHILVLGVQLRSDMTTLANVTCKVRVNGGAATTYTNVSTPAITQNGDITYGYQLKLPALTFNDGDDVEVTWLYSATAYAYDSVVIGPAAVDGASFTTALASALAALSTRTGTAQAGASGSITLDAGASGLNDFYVGQWVVIASGAGAGQSRLITAYTGSTKVATVHTNWKTQPSNTSVFYLLAASDINGVVLADTATTLTNAPPDSAGVTTLLARLSSARASLLDNLSNLDVAVSTRSTVAAIWAAVADSPGITTLLSRLTPTRAANLDYLDADVGTVLSDVVTIASRLPADVWDELLTSHTVSGSAGQLIARLGSGSLTLVSPTALAGKLDLVAGDDYKSADGTAIVFTGTWPTLSSVALYIGDVLTINGTPGAGYVSFDITAVQSGNLPSSTGFRVVGTLSDGSKKTIARGLCTAS